MHLGDRYTAIPVRWLWGPVVNGSVSRSCHLYIVRTIDKEAERVKCKETFDFGY